MTFGILLISFFAGLAASLGLGGGMFLIIYLTVFAGVTQTAAQGINLVFFIPAAAAALWLHTKNGLVEWRRILPAAICGALTAAVFSYVANSIDPTWLKRLFGIFVTIAGMKMLMTKKDKNDK